MVKERNVLSNLLKNLHHGLFPMGFLLVAFIGCKNPTGITGTLSYEDITTSFGEEKTANPESRPAGTVTYSIAPVGGKAMSTEISIDETTGVITVTDQAVVQETTEYLVTATGTGNYSGTTTARINITVHNPGIAGSLSYDDITTTYRTASDVNPTVTGVPDGTRTYSISPAVQDGMAFDTATGEISLSDTASAKAATTYTVGLSVAGYEGEKTASVQITVYPKAIEGTLSYKSIVTDRGDVVDSSASWTGGDASRMVSYSIDPILPGGITIDARTSVITVSDTVEIQVTTEYTVTATGTGNYGGTATGSISITVNTPSVTGLLSDLFADDADMDYLQSEAFAFNIDHMLEIKQDTEKKKIVIRNLAPLDFENVSLLASIADIDQKILILKLNEIKGHSSLILDYPFDNGVKLFATESGQIIDLSSLNGQNPEMTFDYDPGDDPILNKLHSIKSVWKVKFHDFDPSDSESDNWEENMTPHDLRRYTGLMINLAYLFQSPEFKEGILVENLFGNDQTVKTNDEKLEFIEQLFNKDKIRCGKVVNVAGLGGGYTFGVAEHVLNKYLTSTYNMGNVPVHEFGHMLGYNHSSNFTYSKKNGQDVNEGVVMVAQRVAEKLMSENRFPVRLDNYYRSADL